VAKKAVTPIRTIRAYFIKARRESALQQQAGYTEAILSLSSIAQRLAKWEETIYGLIAGVFPDSRHVDRIGLGTVVVIEAPL
jgi:transcription elongation GreA/GreB family factor